MLSNLCEKCIQGLVKRNYISSNERVNVLNGLGIAILTTSKCVMSNKKAKLNNVGGEVLCHVW